MVIDLSVPSDTVFLPADRTRFKDTLRVPEGMRIWLFPYRGTNWRSSMRQDSYLVGTSPDAPPHGSFAKNTKSVTLGFGAVLINAFFTHLQNFDDYVSRDFKGSVGHLWPNRSAILAWPPGPTIGEPGANYVSESMTRLTQSPKVRTIDDFL